MQFDILSAVRAAAALLATVSKYTATKVDDQLSAIFDALLANQALVDFLLSLVQDEKVVNSRDEARNEAVGAFAAAYANASVQSAVSEAGIPWVKFLEYLPAVVRIVLTLLQKR